MPTKQIGTYITLNNPKLVSDNEEVPQGQYLYILAPTTETKIYTKQEWEDFLNGNMGLFKQQLEEKVQGCRVVYLRAVWNSAVLKPYGYPIIFNYEVQGLKFEAVIQNVSGGVTGAEIIAALPLIVKILIWIAIIVGIIAVIYFLYLGSTLASPLKEFFFIGALVIGGLVIFSLVGGVLQYRGKKRSFRVGRARKK